MGAYLTRAGDRLLLSVPYEFQHIPRQISGVSWDRSAQKWIIKKPSAKIYNLLLREIPNLTVHRDADQLIKELVFKAENNRRVKEEARTGIKPLYPMPLNPSVIPFNHQIGGYNLGISNNAAALLFEQGCGKSLTAIAIIGNRVLRGQVDRVLIVCPMSVVPVWPKELESYANFPYKIAVLQGTSGQKQKALANFKNSDGAAIAVINYESAWRLEDEIAVWGPKMIVADESQRIKSPGARQSKGMHNLGKIAKYRLILTGTPVNNSPLDFWSQYKFLDPNILLPNYYAFRNRYAIMGGFEKHQVVGYKNLPELTEKIHSIAFRTTKAEALDLPETVKQNLYCELEPKARAMYNQLVKESVAELEGEERAGVPYGKVTITTINVLSRLLRLSQFAGGFYKDEDGVLHTISNAKMNLFKEILDDLLEAGQKVVVFARFLPEIAGIEKYLKEIGVGFALIRGDVAATQRGPEVDRFQTDPECRVFVAQIATAGLGITLHAASTAIFYSLDYSYANYEQCLARIHRLGQRNTCTYIHLLAEKTVDEKVIKALGQKKNIADAVVDNWQELM